MIQLREDLPMTKLMYEKGWKVESGVCKDKYTGLSNEYKNTEYICVSGRASTILDMYNSFPGKSWSCSINKDQAGETSSDEHNGFAGGSFEEIKRELSGSKDLTKYQIILEKMRKTKFKDNFIERLLLKIPKRKRFMSSQDGEWDMSRKWDIEPFQTTHKVGTQTRILDLYCSFNFSSSRGSGDIDTYGCYIWAIVNLLESSGITVRLWSTMSTYDRQNHYMRVTNMMVKDSGEYLSPAILAAMFSTNFYRRFGFWIATAGSESVGIPIDLTIGKPEQIHKGAVESRGDGLYFGIDICRTDWNNSRSIEDEIMKAVK